MPDLDKIVKQREQAKIRMRKQRKNNRKGSLPETRDVDTALRAGIVLSLSKLGVRKQSDLLENEIIAKQILAKSPIVSDALIRWTIREVIEQALSELPLSEKNDDIRRQRFWARIGLFS